MSTKHVRTASDLVRFKCALKVECGSCGYSTTLNGFDVAKSYGTNPLDDARRRMTCSRCNAREARLTILSPPVRRD